MTNEGVGQKHCRQASTCWIWHNKEVEFNQSWKTEDYRDSRKLFSRNYATWCPHLAKLVEVSRLGGRLVKIDLQLGWFVRRGRVWQLGDLKFIQMSCSAKIGKPMCAPMSTNTHWCGLCGAHGTSTGGDMNDVNYDGITGGHQDVSVGISRGWMISENAKVFSSGLIDSLKMTSRFTFTGFPITLHFPHRQERLSSLKGDPKNMWVPSALTGALTFHDRFVFWSYIMQVVM